MPGGRTVAALAGAVLAGLFLSPVAWSQTGTTEVPPAAAPAAGQKATTASASDPQVTPPVSEPPAAGPEPPAAPPVDPVIAYVRQKLSAPPTERGIDRKDWDALAATYAERTEPPLWVGDGKLTARALAAMVEIRKADDWGLSAAAFELPKLASAAPVEAMGDAEIKLGLAVLEYARHARGGRLDPAKVSRNFDQKPPLRDPKRVMQEIAAANSPDAYLRGLHPKHVQFERLRQALLKARSVGQTKADADDPADVTLPEGPSLKLGVTHPQVAILRRRLKAGASGDPNVFDEPLDAAVKAYQKGQGYLPDGIVGPRSRAILNGQTKSVQTGGTSEVDRVLANMGRWRWMPEDLGDLHVWDNVPEFFMRVVKKGKMIHSAKIVVGKPDTQTPIFSADMRYIVFHPEWGVPNSIKVKEILPYLRPTGGDFFGFGGTDTRVLERHNLRVAYNGRPVDARSVDWSNVDIRQFTFIQPAGPDNVLGVVKFRFPNKHDVYMHDTPQRDLFDKQARTYSHGCMRVQDPQRLAEILLAEDKGWSAAQVRALFSGTNNNEIELTRRIPVHVTYFTAMVGEDGTLRSIADPYGHDRRVLAALAGRPMPLESLHDGSDNESLTVARQSRPKTRDFGPSNFFSGLFGN